MSSATHFAVVEFDTDRSLCVVSNDHVTKDKFAHNFKVTIAWSRTKKEDDAMVVTQPTTEKRDAAGQSTTAAESVSFSARDEEIASLKRKVGALEKENGKGQI